ncbi:MAG: class I SAM-dependent methyltransferase [Chloroflexi bacterium]|nr:class I SAM-dependent methyltransferase [Chloroflexota bacterium]
MDIKSQVNEHYGVSDIYDRVVAALREAGIDPAAATVEDMAPIDQFHSGGLASSRSLANQLYITPDTTIIEAGCGIGGAGRFLAKTYNCKIVGVDLTEDFIAAAGPLNELLGVSDRVSC